MGERLARTTTGFVVGPYHVEHRGDSIIVTVTETATSETTVTIQATHGKDTRVLTRRRTYSDGRDGEHPPLW
jgi:hypothetical protein